MVPSFAAESDPVLFWSLAIFAAMGVGFAKCGIAGIGILMVPIMAHIFPAGQSTGILLPMLVVGDVFAVIYYRKHAVWSHVLRALPWAMGGVIVGYGVLRYVQSQHGSDGLNAILKPAIGAIVLVVLLLGTWLERRKKESTLHVPTSWWFAALIGVVGGFSTMAANAAGPVFVIYLLALALPKEGFLGTSGWIFLILNTFKLPFSYSLGFIDAETLTYNAMMIPAIAAGAGLGLLTIKRIDQKVFLIAVKVLTVAASVRLLMG